MGPAEPARSAGSAAAGGGSGRAPLSSSAAVTGGAKHVVITGHLDLTSLPIARCAALFDSPPQLQSIRVCSTY